MPLQYAEWLSRLLQGDWGVSYRDTRPVPRVIADHLGATLQLTAAAAFIAVTIGTAIGIAGAVRQRGLFDYLSTIGAMVALSIPTFWFGLVVIYVFTLTLGWLPAGGQFTIGDGSFWDYAWHLIAPSFVLALVTIATWSRYMRASMLEVINQDYVRTAKAKGLPSRVVLLHHVARNALLPMVTLAGLQLPTLLSGALVTETVFTWPGIGRLFLDSLEYRDYPVVMGILMFSAVFVILGNLVADALYTVVDPRVRTR